MRYFLLMLGLMLGLFGHANAADKVGAGKTARTVPAPQHRVVIQVNEEGVKKWNEVLANIRNIQAELGAKNVQIAVVAIGPGVGMLTAESLAANGVQDALATGVEFLACGNTLKALNLPREDLIEGVKIVNAGYVEIMRRQQAAWSYLRP